ncbi:MAG: hypothetical protein AB7U82_12015 [Blastocatellales bacterium]
MTLDHLNTAVFSEHLKTPFRVRVGEDRTLDIELIEVAPGRSTPRQEQFSILFHGPSDIFLPQRIYQIEHDVLGCLDLFLVPVGRQEDGFLYEAVFNRLR